MAANQNDRLKREFEGADVLEALLTASKCDLDFAEVVEEFQRAVEEGSFSHEIIPLLWELEPQFPDAATARRTFSNLFGLFDQIAADAVADLVPLPMLDPDAPLTPERADRAWRSLDELADKEWRRARDRFDNVQSEVGAFVFEKLEALEPVALEMGLELAFEAWWICESVRGKEAVVRASRDTLASAWNDTAEGGTEPEPALAGQASTALWEQAAAEDNPLSEISIPVVERALQSVRIALTSRERR